MFQSSKFSTPEQPRNENESTALFEEEPPQTRVQTHARGRKRSLVPPTKEKDPVALHREDTNNAVVDTLKTCQKSCAGAMYDFWHWNNLPGNTPGEKLTTVTTRGGRGPYLLLTFAILLLIIFVIVVVVRSCSAKKPAPPTSSLGFKAPDAEDLRRLAGGTMGTATFETPVAMRPVTTYRQA